MIMSDTKYLQDLLASQKLDETSAEWKELDVEAEKLEQIIRKAFPNSRVMFTHGVLDEVDTPRVTQLFERGNRRADEPADVDRDHGRGLRREVRLDVGEVERHRPGVAVDEDHARAGVDGGRGGCEEGVGGDDHFAALDVERAQDDLERTGTRADRDRVLRRVPFGEGGLELTPDRAQRELAADQRLVDPSEDLGAVFGRERHPGRRHAHGDRIYPSGAVPGRIADGEDRG